MLPTPMSSLRLRRPLPEGTLHGAALHGKVAFVPHPTETFTLPADTVVPQTTDKRFLVRVFFGQLPYAVTQMQLDWLCYTFGGKCAVVGAEKITKQQPAWPKRHGAGPAAGNNKKQMPTGCLHAYASPEAVDALAAGMHKTLLIDDTGVWHATDAAEKAALKAYCDSMKMDKWRRPVSRPYDGVSVERATSSYHGKSTPPPAPPSSSLTAVTVAEYVVEARPATPPAAYRTPTAVSASTAAALRVEAAPWRPARGSPPPYRDSCGAW